MNDLTEKRVGEIIAEFAGKRILVIGDVVVDSYAQGVTERHNPESNAPLLDVQKEWQVTGGAGNVAKNMAALGAQTALVALVGNDVLGGTVRGLAIAEGYELHVITDPARPTTNKVRFLRDAETMLRVDYEVRQEASSTLEDELLTEYEEHLKNGVDGVIISDYAKGVVTSRIAREVIALAKKHNVPIAADVKLHRAEDIKGATFVSPNLKEAREFLGNSAEVQALSWEELAKKLHDKLETTACITLSHDGVYFYESAENFGHVPHTHTPSVIDTSGAGDTAISVLLLARLAGASYQEAAELANAAGAFVIGKVGSATISAAELSDMISQHHE